MKEFYYQNPDDVKIVFKQFPLSSIHDDAQIAAIGERVEASVAGAVKFAEESDEPSIETLYDHVYG